MKWDALDKKGGCLSYFVHLFSSKMNFSRQNLNVVANILIFNMKRYGAALEPFLYCSQSGCVECVAYILRWIANTHAGCSGGGLPCTRINVGSITEHIIILC